MADEIKQRVQEAEERLTELVREMDVPPLRINDIGWLSRNLRVRNSRHENFPVAIQLITFILTFKNDNPR